MRAIIICPVFPPEPVVSAQTSSQIAEALVDKGYNVTVITAFPNRPGGKLYPGFRRAIIKTENSPIGFKLIRCFTFFSKRSTIISRFLENISFGVLSGIVVLFMPSTDLIYANTWPIFSAGIISLVARLKRIPLVLSIQDVYPESLVSQKRIDEGGLAVSLIKQIDGWVARNCAGLIVISDRFREIYVTQRSVSVNNIHVIPNWLDENRIEYKPVKERKELFSYIPSDAFLLVYAGNIGIAAGVEIVIEAVGRLEDNDKLHLVIAGDGTSLMNCQRLSSQFIDSKIYFKTPWKDSETSAVLAAANVLVLPTKGDQSLVSVPSKLISYMLSGRPVIALAHPFSDLARVIDEAECGWVSLPDRPDLLSLLIEQIQTLPEAERIKKGLKGRQYALANYSRISNLPRLINIIEDMPFIKRKNSETLKNLNQ